LVHWEDLYGRKKELQVVVNHGTAGLADRRPCDRRAAVVRHELVSWPIQRDARAQVFLWKQCCRAYTTSGKQWIKRIDPSHHLFLDRIAEVVLHLFHQLRERRDELVAVLHQIAAFGQGGLETRHTVGVDLEI
jgi:hypothetical protein